MSGNSEHWPDIPVTDPNLVGWWKFDEGPSDRTLDSSGHNRYGTLNGSPVFTTGEFDDAISLNGTTDWVSVGSVGISGAAPRTIAGWAKVNATTIPAGGTIFGFAGSGSYRLFSIAVAAGGGYIFNSYMWTQDIMPLDLFWHHFAVTYDGTTVRYYGDGSLVGQADYILDTVDDVRMGLSATNPNNYFPGLIDDVRIYNKVLSEAEIQTIMKSPQAYGPNPFNNNAEVDMNPTLTWKPGAHDDVIVGHNGHKLYFSNDFNDVNERKIAAGPHNISGPNPSYTPPGPLPYPKTYYWAVDEVNGVTTWPGNVWRFTVPIYKVVDNFEPYTATGTQDLESGNSPTNSGYPILPAGSLRRTWIDGLWTVEWQNGWSHPPTTNGTSGSYVQLNIDPCDDATNKGNIAQGGLKSMKFYYDNGGSISWVNDLRLPIDIEGGQSYGSSWNYTAPKYSEASTAVDDAACSYPDQNSLGMLRDWSSYKLLKLSYYGDPNNTLTIVATDKLYVTLQDGSNRVATVTNPDQTYIQRLGWHDWYISLSIGSGSFKAQNASLDLTNIARIYIGIGNKASPVTGGKGAIFFDDIRLYPVSVCIPGTVTGDFNGDCKVDANDLQRMTEVWLGQMPTPPTPVINLDASGLALGTLSTWTNAGSLGGSFKDFNSKISGYRPTVQMVEGVKAVVFDGNDIMTATSRAPASITGTNPFTVIYKVWNLDIGVSERVFAWAKRGGTVYGRFADVGYGTAPSYGAVGHGSVGANDPNYDMGFNRGVPAAHTWHTIAVTYPGGPNSVQTVMVDGLVNATKVMTLNIWPDCNMTIGCGYDGNSTAVPPTSNAITPNSGLFFSGALANLKVYGFAIPPKDLAVLMGTPADMKQDNAINFKDLALFAKNWMVGPVLWP